MPPQRIKGFNLKQLTKYDLHGDRPTSKKKNILGSTATVLPCGRLQRDIFGNVMELVRGGSLTKGATPSSFPRSAVQFRVLNSAMKFLVFFDIVVQCSVGYCSAVLGSAVQCSVV